MNYFIEIKINNCKLFEDFTEQLSLALWSNKVNNNPKGLLCNSNYNLLFAQNRKHYLGNQITQLHLQTLHLNSIQSFKK